MRAAIVVSLLLSVVIRRSMEASEPVQRRGRNPCFTEDRRPQRCFPPFVNAAFNIPVEATNTCGSLGDPEYFCQQTGAAGATKSCDVCDSEDPQKAHPARYLTDFHSVENLTWWQSSTMLEDVQWPSSVNLTISLGKAFEITYVRLKFFSSRPESFAIYKRPKEDAEWIPFQFYSASCEETYNLTSRSVIRIENEGDAVCKDEFSDISPLTGGSVAFSTLEGRPRAYEFERTPVLQDWVTATDIRIVLNRINTFRDEVFGDPNVLRSYFYAISDFAIGGRCKCNGHASECIRSESRQWKLKCLCEHHTDGPDCERCLPFYNDLPWKRATAGEVTECRACDCNGRSETCFFDKSLYDHTGHGGHCTDCSGNTDGAHCERCQDGYYRASNDDDCSACQCHPLGSLSAQCDIYGRCYCKPGVTGDKCDQCQPEFYNLSESGCSACSCSIAGSLYNRPQCDPHTGNCVCKEHAEGQRCDVCKAGFFNLQEDDALGCMPCFCYGHSGGCSLSQTYSLDAIRTRFSGDAENWEGISRHGTEVDLEHLPLTNEISIASLDSDFVYFVFPSVFLGNRRFSYNQLLAFSLRIVGDNPRPSIVDLVIEGNSYKITAPIYAQGNKMPNAQAQDYAFRLNEHSNYQWTPKLTTMEFIRMLSNITAIKLRGTYTSNGIGYLSDVTLLSAVERTLSDDPLASVEQCTCPDAYVGQFCESCAPGYFRDAAYWGPYANCIPCSCNGHSDDCDIDTGKCICDHNTTGEHCERCLDGFYGLPATGTPDDCRPCPCPEESRCVELLSGEVACFDCPLNRTGHRCEFCQNGFYGDPEGRHGNPEPCRTCECNNNIDQNAVGNCNRTTGECLRCIYNTVGEQCERCLPGYYGDALALPHGNCQACECFPLGSNPNDNTRNSDDLGVISCDKVTGLCPCLPNVVGRHCEQCRDDHWNIFSGSGCETCNCDRMGSVNGSCDMTSGQCFCKDGVSGTKCDQCLPNYYAFSPDGCSRCRCDPDGSLSLQCEITTGHCSCRPNVVGRYCDKCSLNRFNLSAGCIDCPVCYETVRQAYSVFHSKVKELREIIDASRSAPHDAFNDTDFVRTILEINSTVHQLWSDAKQTKDGQFLEAYETILSSVEDLHAASVEAAVDIGEAKSAAVNAAFDISEAEASLNNTDSKLTEAEKFLNGDGMSALEEATKQQQKQGQQSDNMTAMAQQARLVVERLEAEADDVSTAGDMADAASMEALNLTRAILYKQSALSDDILHLEFKVNETVQRYDDARLLAEESKNLSTAVHMKSLSLYTDADSLLIHDVNSNGLKQQTDELNATALALIQDVDDLVKNQTQLMDAIAGLKSNASDLLVDGHRQSDALQRLLTDAQTAKEMAADAVKRADFILSEAQSTLTTLQGFDQTVQESQKEAGQALEKVSLIQEYVGHAESQTTAAIRELGDAENDASQALSLAEAARNRTQTAIQDIFETREEISRMKNVSIEFEEDSFELSHNITELEERLRQMELQAEDDGRAIDETLEKADVAKQSATQSSQKVSTALDDVTRMLLDLEQQSSAETQVLDAVEKFLDSTDKRLVDSDLEVRFEGLVEVKVEIERWMSSYEGELDLLFSDVQNIKDINETIPRNCFKRVNIEATDVVG